MRRLILAATLSWSLVSVAAAAQPSPETLPPPRGQQPRPAPQQQQPLSTLPGPASQRHVFLQRYRYSSYGTWVRTMGPGYPAYRYTYSGQKDNFPLPAIFQSGSEHTNYTGGPGF